jgi:Mg-chelatase subunit ChlD
VKDGGAGAGGPAQEERLRRWRLALGDGGLPGAGLSEGDRRRDGVLEALYGKGPGGAAASSGRPAGTGDAGSVAPARPGDVRRGEGRRAAGLSRSAPAVARWLGDIRTYFPTSVVRVLQHDAIERLGLRELLLEPETLGHLEPDVELVAALVALGRVIPEHSRETARAVVRRVTDDLERRLAERTRSAVAGALNRAARTRRPRPGDIDWPATIRANLRHYQPALKTVIPDRLVGFGRKHPSLERAVVLAIDQSASMAGSVVYSGVFAAVLAGMHALDTRLVAFDASVVDLSDELADPVDVLFALQLGGGTDINRAVAYCQQLIERPADTVFVLVSDLFEGGDSVQLRARLASMVRAGVTCVALLALSDSGAPAYNHELAAVLAASGMPAFACTPDLFPELMAAAIERRDLGRWASEHAVPAPGTHGRGDS